MNAIDNLEAVGARMLARKGTLCLVKMGSGLYSVDRISKGCSYSVVAGDRNEAIDAFANMCASQRKGKNDFNLEVFAGRA